MRKLYIICTMDNVRGDFLGLPHGTTSVNYDVNISNDSKCNTQSIGIFVINLTPKELYL